MQYSDEQVSDLIQSKLRLEEENARLKEELYWETRRREEVEKRYFGLCERHVQFALANPGTAVEVDVIEVRVRANRVLSRDDFEIGLMENIVHQCSAKREELLLNIPPLPVFK